VGVRGGDMNSGGLPEWMGGVAIGELMGLALGLEVFEAMLGVTFAGQSGYLVLGNDIGLIRLKGAGFVVDKDCTLDRSLELHWITGTDE
jgi:hypothetical protein